MAEPYDVALRERAVAAYHAGEGGYHQLAAVFRIGWRTLQRWIARERDTGSVAPDPKRGGWQSPIDMDVLHAVVREAPDGTFRELCWEYNRRVPRERRTTPTSFGRAMHRAGFVLKKTAAAERMRPAGRGGQAGGVPEMDAAHRSAPADFSR